MGAGSMEREMKCKAIEAVFGLEKGVLGGPIDISCDIKDALCFHLTIKHNIKRYITITVDNEVSVFDLYSALTKVERLLMIFYGYFVPLEELKFLQSSDFSDEQLILPANNLKAGRLSYFVSDKTFRLPQNTLVDCRDFNSIMSADMYSIWFDLLDELDTIHQTYLYMLSEGMATVDIRCAFLIELAEPLVEIVKHYTHYFTSLEPGKRGTTLKMCLDALITRYGEDIFAKELSSEKYDDFLSAMIKSRVKIMHIKRQRGGFFCNGNECAMYAWKMSLLYRCILFDLLKVDRQFYITRLKKCVDYIDNFDSIIEQFLYRVPKSKN